MFRSFFPSLPWKDLLSVGTKWLFYRALNHTVAVTWGCHHPGPSCSPCCCMGSSCAAPSLLSQLSAVTHRPCRVPCRWPVQAPAPGTRGRWRRAMENTCWGSKDWEDFTVMWASASISKSCLMGRSQVCTMRTDTVSNLTCAHWSHVRNIQNQTSSDLSLYFIVNLFSVF